jgi:hypothetical protein
VETMTVGTDTAAEIGHWQHILAARR